MGQRHQLFVIARIGARYRRLAAIHYQYLYGSRARKVCLRLLHIFQSPESRIVLKCELQYAKTLDENGWDLMEKMIPSILTHTCPSPYMPFPFVPTTLALGASFDERDWNYHKVDRLPFNLAFDGGDNNDGIKVLDITDLANVKYCFAHLESAWSETQLETVIQMNLQYQPTSQRIHDSHMPLNLLPQL